MSFSRDSKQKLLTIAAFLIVALLGTNAYLLFDKFSKAKVIDTQQLAINEADQLNVDLDKKYYESLAELEEMRGNNEELNALIDEQKEALKERKNKISSLIRNGKASKAELEEARSQLSQFKVQMDQYMAENNALKQEKDMLTQKTMVLSEDKKNLEMQVSQERTMNNELVTAKAALVSEKESLQNVNASLSTKVNRASVIDIQQVSVKAEKLKRSGKVTSTKRAKSTDRLKVCFNTEANPVSESGLEKFFVRIITPVGETMAVENLGSGIMLMADGENEIRYTQVKEVDYSNDEMMVCFHWQAPNQSYQKGNYEVEVYNKGFLSGKSTFSLK